VFGGIVAEREHVEVVGDLRRGLGALGAVLGGERLRGGQRAGLVLGVGDLRERLLGAGVGGLRQGSQHVPGLVEPAALLPGLREHVAHSLPEPPAHRRRPRAPVPACQGFCSRRSRSAHDSEFSRNPSANATSSLVPWARTPSITSRHTLSDSRHTLSDSRRTFRWILSTRPRHHSSPVHLRRGVSPRAARFPRVWPWQPSRCAFPSARRWDRRTGRRHEAISSA